MTPKRTKEVVEQWMTPEPYTVDPNDSVTHAIELIEEHRINQLPVVENGRLVGILTDRDLRDAWTLAPTHPKRKRQRRSRIDSDDIPIKALMTRAVLTVDPSDTLEKAAKLLRDKRIGAVPVVAQTHLRGIITRSDILDAFIGRKQSKHANRKALLKSVNTR